MKKIWLFCRISAGLFAFCLVFSVVVSLMRASLVEAGAAITSTEKQRIFVLDAGHGGEDGGAIAADGTQEKVLNLAITEMLGSMLTAAGHTVVYTRREDRLLYTEEQNIRGQRKMYDLRNRLAKAEEQPGAILVSIHMNKFTDPRYSGLQVYYGQSDPSSRQLAQMIQGAVCHDLQPDNHRAIKAAGDTIYLLHHATVPAVLIECGFLSNPEECQKLSQEDYQRQLSFSIFCAMMEYIRDEGGSV